MAVQVCRWSTKTIAMSDGTEVASRWFGLSDADVEAQCGRYVRGKNKGKLRGWIVYRRCEEGGWSYPLQGVIRPGMIWAHFCETFDQMAHVANLPTDRFFPATRVDSQYGYDPAQARVAVAKRAAEAEEAAKLAASRPRLKATTRQWLEYAKLARGNDSSLRKQTADCFRKFASLRRAARENLANGDDFKMPSAKQAREALQSVA